jgi:hypothetical protein
LKEKSSICMHNPTQNVKRIEIRPLPIQNQITQIVN